MNDRRRITTVMLSAITLLLLIMAFVIGIRINENQAPTDTSAATGTQLTECILNRRPDILPFYQSNGWDISQRDLIIANWKTIDPDGYATVSAQCGAAAPAPAPTPTPTPAPAPQTGSTSTRNVCGSGCSSDNDCVLQGTNGAAVGCRGGSCQNLSCIGNTVPGSVCSCSQVQGAAVSGTTGTTGTLPNTAIFDDKTDAILLGIFSIIVGLILWKSNMFENIILLVKGDVAFTSKKRMYRKNIESMIDNVLSR